MRCCGCVVCGFVVLLGVLGLGILLFIVSVLGIVVVCWVWLWWHTAWCGLVLGGFLGVFVVWLVVVVGYFGYACGGAVMTVALLWVACYVVLWVLIGGLI